MYAGVADSEGSCPCNYSTPGLRQPLTLDKPVQDRLLSARFAPACETDSPSRPEGASFMSSVVKKRKKKMRKHKHRKLRRRMKFARRKG